MPQTDVRWGIGTQCHITRQPGARKSYHLIIKKKHEKLLLHINLAPQIKDETIGFKTVEA